VLRPLGRNVLDEANQLYLVAVNETTQFSGTLEVQKVLLDRGQEQYDEQQYYAATNTGLLVLNNLKFILWWEEYSNTKDQDEYLNDLYQTVNLEINHSRQEVERFKEEGLKDVDGVGAAEIRVVMAEQLLEDARSTETEIDYVKTLALASMRAETVLWWLSLVNTDHTTDDGMLKERAGWYDEQGRAVLCSSIKFIRDAAYRPDTSVRIDHSCHYHAIDQLPVLYVGYGGHGECGTGRGAADDG
jgi:predicted S18 family serine protease